MRAPRIIASLTAVAALATVGVLSSAAQAETAYEDDTMSLPRKTSPYTGTGPYWPYVQEILIGGVVPMKNQAIINYTDHGYLFRAGQQHTNLTVTQVGDRLHFVDEGTASWKWLPSACTRLTVSTGVGASCPVPADASLSRPMLLEVWPRLGNDTVDTTALSALVDVSFLGDRGNDVARFGAGDDFFNGAQDADKAYGGAGRDWLRTGLADDFIDGGDDGDAIVGVAENDTMYGGSGDDRIMGLKGNDHLYAGEGRDMVLCGAGTDRGWAKTTDKATYCETLNRS